MTITFSIDPERRRIETRITGALFDADPVHYLEALLDHPAYESGLSTLVLCEDVSVGAISNEGVARIASFARNADTRFKPPRVAVVASQPVVFGLVRMYQMLRNPPYDFRVFREEPEARAWLDAPTG